MLYYGMGFSPPDPKTNLRGYRLNIKTLAFSVSFFTLMIVNSITKNAKCQESSSIREVFDCYVDAIHHSDLEKLFTTITNNQDFFFLTSNGTLIDTREGYYQFHEDWFRETDWEMPVELIDTYEGETCGYSTAIFYYRSKIPDGRTYNLDSYFTLIYHKEKGQWKVVADICTPISRYYTEDDPEIKYDFNQEYLFDIIKNRRTVRKFKPTPVPEEHIIKILDAARMAPTAGNQQPWVFLVVRDRVKLDELAEKASEWYIRENKEEIEPEKLTEIKLSIENILESILSAPVYIAVLVDSNTKHPNYILQDGSLAAGNLMIAARALGYGTGFFTSYFPEKEMREFFNIPDNYKLICFTPIGIPEEWPETPPKKDLMDMIRFEYY
jgi:nitroreductase/ketosteroid isomerase-like protein